MQCALIDQLAEHPEKITEGVVLGMPPFFLDFLQSFTLKADVRPVHGIGCVGLSADDVAEAMFVLAEVLHQRGQRFNGNISFAGHIMRMCDMNIVTHPDIGVTAFGLVLSKTRGGKKTVRQGREVQASHLSKEGPDLLNLGYRVERLDHAGQSLARHMDGALFELFKTLLMAGPNLPDGQDPNYPDQRAPEMSQRGYPGKESMQGTPCARPQRSSGAR